VRPHVIEKYRNGVYGSTYPEFISNSQRDLTQVQGPQRLLVRSPAFASAVQSTIPREENLDGIPILTGIVDAPICGGLALLLNFNQDTGLVHTTTVGWVFRSLSDIATAHQATAAAAWYPLPERRRLTEDERQNQGADQRRDK